MSFFSSNYGRNTARGLLVASVFAGLTLSACAPLRDPKFKRSTFPKLDPKEYMPKTNIGLAAEDELLESFFQEPSDSPTSDLGPCAWIDGYNRPKDVSTPRFRMAEDLLLRLNNGSIEIDADRGVRVAGATGKKVSEYTSFQSITSSTSKSDKEALLQALRRSDMVDLFKSLKANLDSTDPLSEPGSLPKRITSVHATGQTRLKTVVDAKIDEGAQENFALNGRVDIAANPIYQLGLTRTLTQYSGSGMIPDRDQYLKQLDEAINATNFFVKTPVIFLKRLILGSGLADFYKIRNDEIAVNISDSLPGTFDTAAPSGGNVYSMTEKIIPRIVLDNAMKDQTQVLPAAADNQQQLSAKIFKLRRILQAYQKSLPLFVDKSWKSYEQDSRVSINLALKGLLSDEADEQVCGAVLLNRSLSQMLSFMGYVQPPMVADPVVQSSHLPLVGQMLDNPEGNHIRSCPMPGILAQNSVRKMMTPDDLGNTEVESNYELSSTIPDMPSCDTSLAVSEDSWDYPHFQRFYSDNGAKSDDWVALLRSVSQFMTAFNPGAPWWMRDRGLPLMNASDLKQAVKSGGVIPFESHGLALGLLYQGATQLQNKFLVMLDGDNKETTNSDDALAVRISYDQHVPRSKGKIKTTIYSATLMAEAAFKFGVSFKKLSDWRDSAEEYRKSLAYIRKADSRDKMIGEYNDLIRGMFGSMPTLNRLTENSDTSVRHQLQSLGLASAVLVSRFVRPMPDGNYGCYAELHDDLDANVETQVGECTPKELTRWKHLMKVIAAAYGSPLFARYSE